MPFSKSAHDRRSTKPVLASRTVLCSIVGMAVSVGTLFGLVPIGCEEQAKITEALLPIFTLLTSFGTFVFRIVATRMIG